MDVYRCLNCDFKDQLDQHGQCRVCGSSAVLFLVTLPNHGTITNDVLDFINDQLFTDLEKQELVKLVRGRVGSA
jgi:hypothetical protein